MESLQYEKYACVCKESVWESNPVLNRLKSVLVGEGVMRRDSIFLLF